MKNLYENNIRIKAIGVLMMICLIAGMLGVNQTVKAATDNKTWKDGNYTYTYKATTSNAQTQVKEFDTTRYYWKQNVTSMNVSTSVSEAVTFNISGTTNIKIIKVNAGLGFEYSKTSTHSSGYAYTLTRDDPKGTYVMAAYCPGKKIETTLTLTDNRTGKSVKEARNSKYAPTTNKETVTINYTKN